jgi:hypothetical protein
MAKDGVSQAAAWIARLALSFTLMGLDRVIWPWGVCLPAAFDTLRYQLYRE